MTISMRFIGYALLFVATCTFTRYGQTESTVSDHSMAEILGKSYEIALPLPFGHSELSIKFDGQKIERMIVFTENLKVNIHSGLLGDLELIGEPSIAFKDANAAPANQIDRFTITFETGELYDVLMCDCGTHNDNCVQHVRDIVIFTINSKGHVEREILDVRSILEGTDHPNGASCDSDGK